MKPATSDSPARRRLIIVLASAATLMLLAGIGIYGLLAGPSDTSASADDRRHGPAVVVPDDGLNVMPRLPVVAASDDPETFARNVATALFAWDTATGFMPLDYTSVILAVGDPTGVDQAGLASDVTTYLPSRAAWIELRQYATRQHLAITESYVPEAWDTAVAQAQPGQLAPGTAAYTIEGIRHREGIWNHEPVATQNPVAFTVFIVCAPTYETCRLLRLSQLDNPLR